MLGLRIFQGGLNQRQYVYSLVCSELLRHAGAIVDQLLDTRQQMQIILEKEFAATKPLPMTKSR